jgi:gas vesicle protein
MPVMGGDMTHSDDGHDHGGSFVMGLLAGTMLGAGLGLLFAPKRGSDLRHQLSEQADALGQNASERYRRASETASDLANRSRSAFGAVRDAVTRASS